MNSDWRSYPFQLVPGDSQLNFPAAEGEHPDQESDTWFIAGQLDAAESDRSFAFLTIFNKNRPGGTIVADFYTMALFDLDTGDYGTYTDYDMPPANLEPGAPAQAGNGRRVTSTSPTTAAPAPRRGPPAGMATGSCCPTPTGSAWWARTTPVGRMRLDLAVTPTRAPTPVGASTYNGKIVCFGQNDTYSYFQTGMAMTGTLRWGEVVEQVSGSSGHVDRQWFPKYAGGGGTGGDPRARSHEWRTINFDNGVDVSIWRQFDRTNGNALQPFTGVTTSYPDPAMPPRVRRRRRGHGQQLRPLAERGAAAGAAACSGPVHARSSPDHLRHTATGHHRRAARAGPGARSADRIHGRSRTATTECCGANR